MLILREKWEQHSEKRETVRNLMYGKEQSESGKEVQDEFREKFYDRIQLRFHPSGTRQPPALKKKKKSRTMIL